MLILIIILVLLFGGGGGYYGYGRWGAGGGAGIGLGTVLLILLVCYFLGCSGRVGRTKAVGPKAKVLGLALPLFVVICGTKAPR